MKTPRPFGEMFRDLREKRRINLRQFCLSNGFDPGNISKIERGIFHAPHSDEKLREYAKALQIEEGSDEWIEFFDAAALSNGTLGIPKITNEALINRLPVLFRTLDNKELTEEKLDSLIELIKRS